MLVAIGAQLLPGFDLVAEHVELKAHIESADFVVTGEGTLDSQSFNGKVVGGVCGIAQDCGVPALVVVGKVDEDFDLSEIESLERTKVVSLTDQFGLDRALSDTVELFQAVVEQNLDQWA
jgi:glycerate kinase